MSRKKFEAPEEGGPSWMDTYGDMVTLLLTFFVLLFSFSSIDAKKFEEIAQSLSGMTVVAIPALDPNAEVDPVFGAEDGKFVITPSTPNPSETSTPTTEALINGMSASEAQDGFNELYEIIKNHIEQNNLGYILTVEYTDEYTLLLRMSDSAFFDPGSAYLDADSEVVIRQVADILTQYTPYIMMIHIEGYTDNVPIHTANYNDNWDLSYGRANTVREYLTGYTNLDPTLLAVTAYGEFHPIASNDTEEGRAQNRRVDFVIESILKDN